MKKKGKKKPIQPILIRLARTGDLGELRTDYSF
jgi:hypothetical protein